MTVSSKYVFLEILPQLVILILMIYIRASGERMLRGTPDVLHLMCVSKIMLLEQPVNMQLCELESTLIHALLLHIVNIRGVRHVQ